LPGRSPSPPQQGDDASRLSSQPGDKAKGQSQRKRGRVEVKRDVQKMTLCLARAKGNSERKRGSARGDGIRQQMNPSL